MEHHHHEEYDIPKEIIPKLKNYWREPDTYNFTSKIKEIDGEWLRLNQNYFYPEGGGQLPDLGVLIPEGNIEKNYKVIDVQIKNNNIWLKSPNHQLIDGQIINGIIDKGRRLSLSRNHSAQHLISAIFWEEMGFETTRAEIKENECQVEFNKSPTFHDLEKASKIINKLIEEDLIIDYQYFEDPPQMSSKVRGEFDKMDVYRLVAIGKYDLNPCGGTHVSSTKQIDAIFINKIESKKLRFYSGFEAKSLLIRNSIDIIKLSRITRVPPDQIPATVEQLIARKIAQDKQVSKLEAEIIELKHVNELFSKVGKYKLKFFSVPIINKSLIISLNANLHLNEITLAHDENQIFVLSSYAEHVTQKLMDNLREIGIKGGGSGKSILGNFSNYDKEELKSVLMRAIDTLE